MINETTLTISLVILMALIFVSIGYLFFVLINRLQMKIFVATLYIIVQVTVCLVAGTGIYHIISPYVDSTQLSIESLQNYSFYHLMGWNVYFGILAFILIISAISHQLYSIKINMQEESSR